MCASSTLSNDISERYVYMLYARNNCVHSREANYDAPAQSIARSVNCSLSQLLAKLCALSQLLAQSIA